MNALAAFGILVFVAIAMILVANRTIWWGLKQGRSPFQCVGFSVLTLLVFYAVTLILIRVVFHQDIISIWHQEFEASLKASTAIYLELGWNAAEIKQAVDFIRRVFMQGAAGWVLMLSIGFSLVSYLVMRRLFPLLSGATRSIPPFTHWGAPEKTIWFLLGTLSLVVLGSRTHTWIAWLSLNSLIVMGGLYLFIGLAVVMFYLEKRKIPRIFKVLLVALLGFVPAMMIFIILIGVFDTWWDWRKIRQIK
ncbi:YybS family protein [bacterium]|nr:YybS family protein [bacterium]